MNFIIFDLEATCWEGGPKENTQEIIEIGALVVNRFGEILGRFSKLIRPVLNPVLSIYCRQLTHIDQIEINRSETFPLIIEDFIEWAGIETEEYLLCSWGGKDKTLLIQDCQLHEIDDSWVEPHINLKSQYHDIKRLRKQRGLKHTIEAEGFEFTGDHHRALSDAENLAKIFVKYLDEWQF